jgi:hypothetical protein
LSSWLKKNEIRLGWHGFSRPGGSVSWRQREHCWTGPAVAPDANGRQERQQVVWAIRGWRKRDSSGVAVMFKASWVGKWATKRALLDKASSGTRRKRAARTTTKVVWATRGWRKRDSSGVALIFEASWVGKLATKRALLDRASSGTRSSRQGAWISCRCPRGGDSIRPALV